MSFSTEVLILYKKLYNYKEEIDFLAVKINSGETVFGSISIQLTNSSISELNFQRVVSWLYTLYWEAGKKSDIKFLIERFSVTEYSLDIDGKLGKHFELVRSLRTYFQHNIATEDNHNNKVQRTCNEWFKEQCETSLPIDEQTWDSCLISLIQDAEFFLKALLKCIEAIENDESRDEIIHQWSVRRKRYFSPWEFDNLIREITGDLGISKDVVSIRNKYQNKWSSFLKTLPIDSDFKTQAKQLILSSILEEQLTTFPLLPEDIIIYFGIEAGSQKVYELLKKAKCFYKNNPALSKDDLIEKLRAEV
ncbi:hypothetical protein [Nostoc sp. UIC 10630]|uniref:hypothetical protein n=1 Tax=Nostoc sp. UIC 10630 TaxID=2100146 RepID=UPI0013D059EE|nr:hypothetical protein [Nostoc sp. UIC 10630]NEU79865.1 hypothetical protein [Nostoc sp. UIC 10630]